MNERTGGEHDEPRTQPSQPTAQPPAAPNSDTAPTIEPTPKSGPQRAQTTSSPAGAGGAALSTPARGTVRSIHYTLSYLTVNPERGPRGAIVLLHDLPGGGFTWEPTLLALAGTGRAVYAFDMLAYGQSSHPWPSDTSIWGHADCLLYAFERMRLSEIVLVGLGLGGGVAQVLATRLFESGVARLALVDSYAYEYAFAPNWPFPEMAAHQDPEAPHHAQLEEVLSDLRTTFPNGSAHPEALTPERLERYVNEWNGEVGKHLLFQHVRLMVPSYQNAPASDLRQLRIPVMIVWGERDSVTPIALGERLAREIPAARFERIAGAGHLVVDDAPDVVGRLLADFGRVE